MIKLFTTPKLPEIKLLQAVLEAQGIQTVIFNETPVAVGARLWPELWIKHNEDSKRAQEIYQEWAAA
jgi:hypothetical protein